MAGDEILEGVEYTVVGSVAREVSSGETGSTAESTTENTGGKTTESAAASIDQTVSGGVGEYARALRTLSADSGDHMAALEVAILGWLDAKRGRSGSERTARTYTDTLASFRAALQREGVDLDGPVTPVALIAQAWAGSNSSPTRSRASRSASVSSPPNLAPADAPAAASGRGPTPAPTTYNQRLASVSSFYKYARKQGILQDNPIERVERRRVQAYAGSRALEAEYVRRALASIDRITSAGARDYALLFTYLQTGRRLSEVAALECRDLEELPGGKLRVTFRRCKGGKILHDTLTKHVSAALLAYLYILHRLPMSQLAGNTPVWVSLAERNGTWGGRLSRVSISRICKARLGTTRVHTLRSTMAQVMEKQGAPVSLIQQRLAHSSLATTGIYLASLRQDDNPYADDIAGAFGAE